jgi:hypothetical protein
MWLDGKRGQEGLAGTDGLSGLNGEKGASVSTLLLYLKIRCLL